MAGLELPPAALLSNTQGSLHRRESDQKDLCDDGTFTISDKITCGFAQETYPGEIDLAEFPTKQHALSLRTFDSGSACNGSLVLDPDDGLHILQHSRSLRVAIDPNIVDWDGPDDHRNPYNWPAPRKWAITVVISALALITTVASTGVAPALPAISRAFEISTDVERNIVLSVFLLSIAIGPLFLAPLSEMYGRSIVLQLSNLVFIIFNLACGLAQSKEQLIIFRFLAGLGGSASQTVGGGSLTDIFVHEERGKAIGIFCLAPVLGPALGPISGGYITEHTSWRWVFHSVTIAAGLVQIFAYVTLRETFPPLVLNKIKRERIAATGNTNLRTRWDAPRHSTSQAFRPAIIRPFRLLGTQLIVQILAIYLAFIFGVLFLVLATFSELWVVQYHQSLGTSGLNYLSMAIGLFVAAQLGSRWQDQIYITLKNRSSGHGKPEFRIPLLIPGAILVPAGLLWYAWSAERHLHWIMPNIGIALFSAGVIIEYLATQTYIVDVYTHFAASALGATSVLRNLAGFGFPLFAKHLYHRLHLGYGNSLLALIAIVLGWPAPFLLWWYGESWRKRSPFAVG